MNEFEKFILKVRQNGRHLMNRVNKALDSFEEKVGKALDKANDKIDEFQEEQMGHKGHHCDCSHCKCHEKVEEAVEPEFDEDNQE